MDNSAILSYILRDHDACKLESKKATLKLVEKLLNEKWWDKGEEWIKEHASEFYSDELV